MGIIKATAYPSRYMDEEETYSSDQDAQLEQLQCLPYEQNAIGTFYCYVELCGGKGWKAKRQRDISLILAKTLEEKAVYQRQEAYYRIGDWSVSPEGIVRTGHFDIDGLDIVLRAFGALAEASYMPQEELNICFQPEKYNADMIFNLYSLMESRMPLIIQALDFSEGGIQIIIDYDLTFSLKLGVFDLDAIEACVYLLRQVSQRASGIRNARSQPCDMSNPKYQMRTWLLRLGFIGEKFEHPRQTLMRNLEGNSAFYTDESKRRFEHKRKAQRLSIQKEEMA